MSDYELNDLGGGRFELSGEMSFRTANAILKSSAQKFAAHASVKLDLSRVGKADSAGLALLIEWKAQVNQRAATIEYIALPESLAAIATTTEVSDLIQASL